MCFVSLPKNDHVCIAVFFVLLTIQQVTCNTTDSTLTVGTCLSSTDCNRSGGRSSGTCARGFGVCCIARHSCGETTSYNNTYFVNPNFNSTDSGTGACTLTVNRVNTSICQLRLDFLDFQLAQPDVDGNCNVDFLTVSPSSTVPRICGSNSGQHSKNNSQSTIVYLEVDPLGGPVRVTVDRSGKVMDRSWIIKVTQITCDSQDKGEYIYPFPYLLRGGYSQLGVHAKSLITHEHKVNYHFKSKFWCLLFITSCSFAILLHVCLRTVSAPSGCLQYYTTTSGTVSSFNFNTDPTVSSSGQIADLDYGVCVKMADGYCGIIWETNSASGDNYTFTLTGNVDAIDQNIIGTPAAATYASECTSDYVMIPGGVDDTGVSNDRYCGLGFPNSVTCKSPTVTSIMKPFILYSHHDSDEAEDQGNTGFSLNFRQITNC
ncbi:uncharacterized protein [Cherax quadricarinatus]|uniref:uncharacterized protein n=1 Tax=Cherax quadricarinatus TaxID=27406 RepID=UPI00387E2B11